MIIPSQAATFAREHSVPLLCFEYPHQLPRADFVSVGALSDGERILYIKQQGRGWELPGGKREDDETPYETAVREVQEETGYVMETSSPAGVTVFLGPSDSVLTKFVWTSQDYTRTGRPESGIETTAWRRTPPSPLSFGAYEHGTLLLITNELR